MKRPSDLTVVDNAVLRESCSGPRSSNGDRTASMRLRSSVNLPRESNASSAHAMEIRRENRQSNPSACL
jgi:hypothetical protein